MLEAAVASVSGWFTPTVLFLLLNLVIATIALTSSSKSPSAAAKHHFVRSPSIILDRLRSFNIHSHRAPADSIALPPPDSPPHCDPEPEPELLPAESEQHHHIERSQSDTRPAAGEVPTKLAKRLKKSASTMSAFDHFKFNEVEEEAKWPATAREQQQRQEDPEVDARADDFINRFKQQLKLQRLNSIIRYREMINRGSG